MAIMYGTLAIFHIIQHPRPSEAAARANTFLRKILHPRPNNGLYVKNGRRKLAINL